MAVIRGTQDNDILRGSHNDTIEGLGGNDTLFAAFPPIFDSTSSQLLGGDGDDLLSIDVTNGYSYTVTAFNNGGSGNDTISYSSVGSAISVDLSVNQVSFSVNSSVYRGNILSIENVISGRGNDTLIGDDLNNSLNGRQGNDFINGGEGNDTLNGYDGNDFLESGNGDDFLEGGFGSNSLNGGSGTDTAVFSGSTNQYEITVDGDTTTVVWIGGGGVESTDVLNNIEKLKFSNGTFDNGVIINPPDDNNPPDNGNDSLLNTSFNRFRNKFVGGTYLFANQTESANIVQNYSGTFALEGEAFKVSSEPADGLVRFNRFANLQVAGTYLFATEGESQSIRQNFSNVFREEGIAFYAYGADANQGTDYYRLANTQVAGTYLFVSEAEKNSALAQFPNLFRNEGVAFEVG